MPDPTNYSHAADEVRALYELLNQMKEDSGGYVSPDVLHGLMAQFSLNVAAAQVLATLAVADEIRELREAIGYSLNPPRGLGGPR